MRSFAAIFTILSLPLYVFAAHVGNRGDHNVDLAVRARGDVLQERGFDGRFTFYYINVGVYVPRLCPHALCLIISTARLAVELIAQMPM